MFLFDDIYSTISDFKTLFDSFFNNKFFYSIIFYFFYSYLLLFEPNLYPNKRHSAAKTTKITNIIRYSKVKLFVELCRD